MPERFRLHLDPHEKKDVPFVLKRNVHDTILHGWKGAALLVPHLTLPIYGIYWAINRYSLWPAEFETYLGIGIGLLEGLSLGAMVGLGMMRYSSAGKAIKGRRIEKTATDEESRKQQAVEVAFRAALYVFLACLFWEYLVHSPYSPMTGANSKQTFSGLFTSSERIKDYLNNESIIHQAQESRDHMAGVGVDISFDEAAKQAKYHIDNSPKITLGARRSQKSEFLKAWEWAYRQVRGDESKRIGLWELGPKNWMHN